MVFRFQTADVGSDDDFAGYSLILPSVSVGNVGQLACDLFISSLKLKKVGNIWTQCVLPLIGSNPFSSSDASLTLSIEVFSGKERKLAVLQQRAPVVAGMQDTYTGELIKWIEEKKFKHVIMLSSCHAYERRDEDLTGPFMRFLVSKEDQELKEKITSMCGARELLKRKNDYGEKVYSMPGGGFAKLFYEKSASCEFTAVLLMMFCSEGNNIPEALAIANAVNAWKKFLPQQVSLIDLLIAH